MKYARLAELLLGTNKGRVSGLQLRMRCPLHHGDDPNFSLNLQTGDWVCWSGQCGPDSGRDFPTLVMLLRECSYMEALAWMRKTAPLVPSNIELHEDITRLLLGAAKPPTFAQAGADATAQWFDALGKTQMALSFLRRGFSWDIVHRYDIRYDDINDAVVVPLRGYAGEWLGYVMRYMNPSPGQAKYYNAFIRGGLVWPLTPKDAGLPIILTEGPLDALWLRQHGFAGASTFGVEASETQIQTLKHARIPDVFIMYDADDAGRRGTQKLVDKLLAGGWLLSQLRIVSLPPGRKDAQECSLEELQHLETRMVV
jgi:hypothetical protein